MSILRLSFLATLFLSSICFAGTEADLIQRSVDGEHMLMARDYAGAQVQFQKILEDYPESPAGAFGVMALWQTRMFENRDFRFVAQYDAAEKKMEALCDARLKYDRPTDWDLFVCGSGFGMKGFFDARRDKWLQGLGGAIKSIRTFRRLIWLNPQFVDADMGIGMYEFWRSVVTQRMKWLPFFSDQRAEGMAKVERVTREGKYVRDLARANYTYMQMEMKQYDPALATLTALRIQYPKSVLIPQAIGEIYWDQKRYQDCYAIYAQILKMDPQMTRSLYWMAASSVIPYMKVDAQSVPLPDAKIPADLATQANSQLHQYLQSNPIKIWAAASHYWLGLIAEYQGDKPTAIAEYNEALKLDSNGSKEIKQRLARVQ